MARGVGLIVTIDGPAGAGKSSVARALAERLGIEFLDTGAMYRAVALAALRAGVDLRACEATERLLTALSLDVRPGEVYLNGENVSQAIRTAEVTAATGASADSPVVRCWLTAMQRQIARNRSLVTEGRDQGTLVFPDAACKFFLVADPQERARRRQRQMAQRGEQVDLETVLAAQEERDRRDAARDIAPMRPADDALVVETTGLSVDAVVALLETEVRKRMHAKE
jgi:cytidylate kinase